MKVSHLMIGLLSLVLFSRAELATAQATAETITKTGAEKKDPPSEPVSVENGKAALTPKNTTIQFVGLHQIRSDRRACRQVQGHRRPDNPRC